VKVSDVLQAWRRILEGRVPSLSIEITRECPLHCPGCYAYHDGHLGDPSTTLRDLADYRGAELVEGILRVVDQYQPLHLSLVGGDPLVRYRELEVLLPKLLQRDLHVQIVTSAFRPLPESWATYRRLNIAVSIDGLPPEHNIRRAPATYDRILANIRGHHVTVHCTITSPMMRQPRYLERFLDFWSANENTRKIWMSIFTPQQGENSPECLTREERERAIRELLDLRPRYPKLDMEESMLREFLHPPVSPARCIFAQTTATISADLRTPITPCQFGGNPDCSQCGCVASMGLAAVGHHKVLGSLTAGHLFFLSNAIGKRLPRRQPVAPPRRVPDLVQIGDD